LNEILHGGLLPGRSHLVTGAPGTGKTILGLQFLNASTDRKRALIVTFTQPEMHLKQDAESIGIDSEPMSFVDLSAEAEIFSEVQTYDIFSPAEVEREPIAAAIRARIEEINPERIFVDGFSELRMISSDVFHFLRISQSFFRFANGRGSTVVVSATEGMTDVETPLRATTDGVIRLAGNRVRSLEVVKMRGSDFAAGPHPMRITPKGIEVFPESA